MFVSGRKCLCKIATATWKSFRSSTFYFLDFSTNANAVFVEQKPKQHCSSIRLLSSDSACHERLSRYSYWKELYEKTESSTTFDWFIDSSLLLENIDVHLGDLYKNTSPSVLKYLELGCGNSDLPSSVYKESSVPVFVFAIDYITQATQQQNYQATSLCPKNSQSQFQAVCGDVMRLPFQPQSFDIAVDKGTMDALLKNKDNGMMNSSVMLSEVIRCLTPGGRYVQISDEDPDSRLDFLYKLTQWNEQNIQSSDHSIKNNILFRDHGNLSQEIAHETISGQVDKGLDHFEDIREDVKMSIVRNEVCESSKADKTNKGKSVSSFWRFKVISLEDSDKEYFMYWLEKG